MRFEQLEQFVALGNLRHFRQAAEQTQISTSALTRSIQTLEDEIGCELVKRSTRSVKLTEQGELFLKYCKTTLSELDLTKKTIKQSLFGRDNQKLIIGYTTQASSIVPVSCGQFLAQYPNVKIEMQLQDELELTRKLQLGEIDISVYLQSANSIVSDIHLPDQLVLFVSRNHPLANQDSIRKAELTQYPMYGCFSQSKQVQSMLNEAVDSLNKSTSVKIGNIEQVIDGLKNSNSFAIASIEHSKTIAQDPNLVFLKTNKALDREQLIVQTNHQVGSNAHINHLLELIEDAASSSSKQTVTY
ncbi:MULTISPECIES: LysR family transcriptional regulator [Pseudoalteromonas]|uniref:LysR family transcriptional regulator n=2 Tax=Pseudoalteromonas TaxID=53246 RepID=A0AAD0RIB1_PSEO7|nr:MULTISPECIES: LysR family transcriptional regulator [Pseudoalteromonas]ASD66014.1 LysR family transcriptional regulator [Pseudoalteromonas piscicida]AXQ96945.1 LysR family transcriptional regulator [Pseudoalteromonas piscicida]AXR03285.1 LysR family transcriptional regulator [Pseudoalteromonas piscicida]KJY87604.1 LysR family transcriptional regulator [Pseudoalteromonas piscicida]MCG7541878.1 LysR family transcriptional regulator [Pseudoalteromonas sp. OF7H-1]